jgi:uncharacterized Rmd1/YagE family protein
VVLFGLTPVEEASFLNHLSHLIVDSFDDDVETEEGEVRVDPQAGEGARDGIITIHGNSVERLQLVADVLARSVVLAHYESNIADAFDRVGPLAHALQRPSARATKTKELLRHIGGTLIIQHRMVGLVEIEDKPELLWELPELERLYGRLTDEYELRERHRALERKLAVISRTAETLLGLIQNRSSLRVEWYIVVLIVVEILIMLWEMTTR